MSPTATEVLEKCRNPNGAILQPFQNYPNYPLNLSFSSLSHQQSRINPAKFSSVKKKKKKMSHCLSNLSISSLFTPNPNPLRSTHSPLLNPSICPKNVVKAIAADGRDNLDHLQRQQKQIQTQQPRKRTAPVVPIGLWDRFPTARTVQQMMETMERMTDDPFVYSNLPQSDSVGYSRGRTPWEIKEAETEYKMRFDMPGMTKEDVKVWVEEKMLVVKAEKLSKKDENGEDWSVKSYGKYSSRIALPENVEFDKIKAEVKDGVLYITIPKASSSAKVFDINVE